MSQFSNKYFSITLGSKTPKKVKQIQLGKEGEGLVV